MLAEKRSWQEDEPKASNHEPPETPPPSKKQKVLAVSTAGFEDLDGLPIDIILGFLKVKQLLRLALCCKRFGLFIKHEHVVRSAMMSGEKTKATIRNVINQAVKERTIFLPSPLRMLRLANGIRCESARCRKRVNHRNILQYGLFLCWGCTKSVSSPYIKYNREEPNVLQECRVAHVRHLCGYNMLNEPFVDSGGEIAGSIVTRSVYTRKNRTRESLQKRLQQIDKEDEWSKEKRESILRCCEEAEADKKILDLEKRDEKKIKLRKMHEMVRGFMKDTPYRDAVLRLSGDNILLVDCLSSGLAREYLGCYWRAPSKGSKTRMKEVAHALDDCIDVIVSSGFNRLSFLSCDSPLLTAFKEHAITELHVQDDVCIVAHPKTSGAVVNFIRKGEPGRALELLFNNHGFLFSNIFANVMSREGDSGRLATSSARKLMQYCCLRKVPGTFVEAWEARATLYRKLLLQVNEAMECAPSGFSWGPPEFQKLEKEGLDKMKDYLRSPCEEHKM